MSLRSTLAALALILSCAMFIACGGAGSSGKSGAGPSNAQAASPNEPDIEEQAEAEQYAEKCILKFIKHPLDASFAWGNTTGHMGEHTWVSSGTFTAKNGFGAELTHKFECYVWLENNTWNCRSVIVDDEILYANDTRSTHERAKSEGDKAAESATAKADENAAPTLHDQVRMWTSADGKHKTEANFSGYKPDSKSVLLTKTDGSIVTVPLDKLSADDQALVKAEVGEEAIH